MRVLHVIPSVSPIHGGPTRTLATMEAALSAAGVAVTTLTTDDNGPMRRFAPDARPRSANGVQRIFARKLTDFYKVAPGVVHWLWSNARSFDVIHIHALFSFVSVCAALIAHMRGVPYIVRPLGTLTAYGVSMRRPWLKKVSLVYVEGPLLRRAAAVHFTSQQEHEEAMGIGLELRGLIVPLGIESVEPEETAPRCSRMGDDGQRDVQVLFLSRLDPKKNAEGLLRAFAMLTGDHQRLRLIIAGDGQPRYVAELRALAASLGILDRVEWLGHVEGAQKARLLGSVDMFVLPSFSENFGIAAAEAMAAGLPSILGRGIAIAGDAEQEGAALVVGREPEEIAEGMLRLIGDSDLRRTLGQAAREHVLAKYSAKTMAQRLITVYSRAALERRAP